MLRVVDRAAEIDRNVELAEYAHLCILPGVVQWDGDKAASNLEKHGIDFADAATVLEDEFALSIEDGDHAEQRFVTIGSDALGRILVVVYAWRDDEPRLISARSANRYERRQYEEGE